MGKFDGLLSGFNSSFFPLIKEGRAASARKQQSAAAQKLAQDRLGLQQDNLGLRQDAFGLQQDKFDAYQSDKATAAGVAQEERDQKVNQGLSQALNIQKAVEQESAAGNLTPEQRARVNAAGNGDEQSALLNSIIAGNEREPVTEKDLLQQQKLAAEIEGINKRNAEPAKSPNSFQQVSGADLGLTGPDAQRIYNVDQTTNKISSIGGGGVTVNTGDKVDQARQIDVVRRGGKRGDEISEQLRAIDDADSAAKQIEASLGEAPSGFGAGFRTGASKIADAIPFGRTALEGIEAISGSDVSVNVPAAEAVEEAGKREAMSNLRAMFGGNPTEGERQAALDLQVKLSDDPATQQRKMETQQALRDRKREVLTLTQELIVNDNLDPAEAERIAQGAIGEGPDIGQLTSDFIGGGKSGGGGASRSLTTPGGISFQVEG